MARSSLKRNLPYSSSQITAKMWPPTTLWCLRRQDRFSGGISHWNTISTTLREWSLCSLKNWLKCTAVKCIETNQYESTNNVAYRLSDVFFQNNEEFQIFLKRMTIDIFHIPFDIFQFKKRNIQSTSVSVPGSLWMMLSASSSPALSITLRLQSNRRSKSLHSFT